MPNEHAIELMKFQPDRYGGFAYTEDYGDGHLYHATCSQEGYDMRVALARIHEVHIDTIETWMDIYGLTQCEHRRPLKDLTWGTNDYMFDPMTEGDQAWFLLYGWHDDGAFCAPWSYRAVGPRGGVFLPW